MSAADEDLTELVERAAAAEQAALAAKWKPRADVDAVRRKVRRAIDEHREHPAGAGSDLHRPSARWSGVREALLVGDPEATDGAPAFPRWPPPHPSDTLIGPRIPAGRLRGAAAREAEAVAAVTVARPASLERRRGARRPPRPHRRR